MTMWPLRLIVAEDDAAMRGWLRKVVDCAGIEVREATSGWETLFLLAENADVDLVISDVRIPSPTGLQVLAMARTAGITVPFLLITAFGTAELRHTAATLGASVLDKPFTAQELRACIGAIGSG